MILIYEEDLGVNMKAGMLLLIIDDFIDILRANQILDENGNFSSPNLQTDARIADQFRIALEHRGLDTPDKVDKIIQALPLLFEIIR